MKWKNKLKRNTENIRSLHDNVNTYNYYEDRFKDLAISNFVYDNLPKEVNARFTELELYTKGYICFAYDEDLGKYICLPCMVNSLDEVGEAVNVHAYGRNGYNKDFINHKDCVIIYNNNIRTNCVDTVRFFASKLCDIDRTIDTNIFVQKTPFLVRTSEDKLLSANQIVEQYENNNDVIKIDERGFTDNSFGVFTTNAPYISDKMYNLKVQYYNECLTYLGVSNISYQKQEHLISDEVNRSQGGVIANRNCRLQPRQRAIDEINELFGLDIKVRFDESIDNNLSNENIDESLYNESGAN